METERVHAGEVPVILPYDLVDFEVPALDRLRRVFERGRANMW